MSTDEAVWHHWNKVVDSNATLFREQGFNEIDSALASKEMYKYCFIYLADKNFSANVESVVSLQRKYPKQIMIVFPNQASQAAALRLFSVGVLGQCSPYIGREQLKLVLSVVDSGEIWGGKAFINSLISQSASLAETHVRNDQEDLLLRSEDEQNMLAGLSDREHYVATLVSNGLSNKQIANEMDITERTVKAHLTAIFKKTHTKDRLSLALLTQNSPKLSH
ncbi:helix-turn-helix transcriptional regulator [Marinomonas spartinae]|uniref:helix-turn-helix transcriptional regulator n=1 Tax=Marinomonas spartinae TaxID=1792290 RepID=UPI001FDEAAEF|nr:LuxR C-terminal-related transcriptional regulator [Marinomonas spartinae]